MVDTEALLDVFEPAFMTMPKIRRIHGAAVRMEEAAYDIIKHYYIAYNLDDEDELKEKEHYIREMIGSFGILQSSFKRLMKVKIDTQKKSDPEAVQQMGMFTDKVKLDLAKSMERIEEGMLKWKNSIKKKHHD